MDQGVDGSQIDDTRDSVTPVDLASRIAAQDRTAETELIERYSKAIRFFLKRRFRDPMMVEDVWQETFCRVITKIRDGKLLDPKALPGFVRSTAIFVGHEFVRQDQKYRSDTPAEQMVELPSYAPTPLELANTKDIQKLVRDVLQEITIERDRNILLRFYLDNIDKTTICGELDLKPNHFDRVLYRAKQRLKQKLEHKFGSNSPEIAAAVSMLFGGRP